MAHGMDMQGRNVMAVHIDETRPTFGEHFAAHNVVDIAHRAGSSALEHLIVQPVGRVLAMAGAVLHLS